MAEFPFGILGGGNEFLVASLFGDGCRYGDAQGSRVVGANDKGQRKAAFKADALHRGKIDAAVLDRLTVA